MPYLVVPITKWPLGFRIGPRENQDWYRSVVKALKLAERFRPSEVVILSAIKVWGKPSEAKLYTEALDELNTGGQKIRVIEECTETISQLNYLFDLAVKENKDLILISTPFHYLRVEWLIHRNPVYKTNKVIIEHFIAWGLPRLKEALTDIILTFTFPLIDLFGYRQRFLEMADHRRRSGIH